jgi:hypothetical protein
MEVGDQLHAAVALFLDRYPGTHWTGDWVVSRAGLDEILDPTRTRNANLSIVHPLASRYRGSFIYIYIYLLSKNAKIRI